jgi:putative membrane protein
MRVIVIVTCVALLAASALAGEGRLRSRDQHFIDRADSFYLGEVDAGTLALRKGTTEPVRLLGERVVRDQRKALEQLRAVGARSDLRVPGRLQDPEVRLYQRLDALTGAPFDEAYVAAVRSGYASAIRVFEAEARHGHNRELRAHAEGVLPMLRAHRATAMRELERM